MSRRPAAVTSALAAVVFALALSLPATGRGRPSETGSVAFPSSQLAIQVASGVTHPFTVEVARTPAQRARGLMYRTHLHPSRGMLFVYPSVRRARMWMKDTLLSLDMLFLAADGRILEIAERTEPLSSATIASKLPVLAVLELAGGRCQELGISPGDRAVHPTFAPPHGAAPE